MKWKFSTNFSCQQIELFCLQISRPKIKRQQKMILGRFKTIWLMIVDAGF